jgi:hypothetical protein
MKRLLPVVLFLVFCNQAFAWPFDLGVGDQAVKYTKIAQDGISFAWPYRCVIDGREGLCLRQHLLSDFTVALVRKTGICYAKTDIAFSRERRGRDEPSLRTALAGSENCWGPMDKALHGDFVLAVVGIDRAAGRLLKLSNDEWPLPKDIELKARVIADTNSSPGMGDQIGGDQFYLSILVPKVRRVGDSSFQLHNTGGGPIILLNKNDVFGLCGNMLDQPIFFSVHEKLYLTYEG